VAIAALSGNGSAQSKTAGTSLAAAVAGATIPAGSVVLAALAKDNLATSATAADYAEVTSVTDSSGNLWFKLYEHTITGSAAAGGVVLSIWKSKLTTGLTLTTQSVTFNFGSVTAKALIYKAFSVGAGNDLRLAATPQKTTGSANLTSQTISGLPSASYLFVKFAGMEAAATSQTVNTNYTALGFNATSGGSGTTNIAVAGQYRILTATGDSCTGSLSTTGDNVQLYMAFEEFTPVAVSSLTDDFTGTTINSSKWTVGLPATAALGPNLQDNANVVSQNNELIVTIGSTTNGSNGIYSVVRYSLDNDSFYVHPAMQDANVGINILYGADPATDQQTGTEDLVRVAVRDTNIQLLSGWRGASSSLASTTYDPTSHYFVRVRHDRATDTLKVDGAPNSGGSPGTFTNILSAARPKHITLNSGYIWFTAGSLASNPGTTGKIDGVNTALSASASVTPANATHAHSATSPTLATNNSVAPNNAAHALTSTQPSVGMTPVAITPANSAQAHSATSPALATNNSVVPNSATHGHSATQPVIATNSSIVPANAAHGHTATQPTIATNSSIVAANAAHTLTSTQPALATANIIVPANAAHALSSTVPTLATANVVVPASTAHAHSATSPSVATNSSVTPANAAHNQTATQPTLTTSNVVIPSDTLHTQVATSPSVAANSQIVPDNAAHGLLSTSPSLVTHDQVVANDATHSLSSTSPVIGSSAAIVPANAFHQVTSGQPSITVPGLVAVNSAVHAHTASQPVLGTHSVVLPDAAQHTLSSTSPVIGSSAVIQAANATSALSSTMPVLGAHSTVLPNDSLIQLTSSSPSFVARSQILPDDSGHGHLASSPTMFAPMAVLPGDSFHNLLTTSPALSTLNIIPANDTWHEHSATSPSLVAFVRVRTYPLAGIEQGHPLAEVQEYPLAQEQGYPLTTKPDFPLAGITQSYPLEAA
jgi:hypothetical protein